MNAPSLPSSASLAHESHPCPLGCGSDLADLTVAARHHVVCAAVKLECSFCEQEYSRSEFDDHKVRNTRGWEGVREGDREEKSVWGVL